MPPWGPQGTELPAHEGFTCSVLGFIDDRSSAGATGAAQPGIFSYLYTCGDTAMQAQLLCTVFLYDKKFITCPGVLGRLFSLLPDSNILLYPNLLI